MSDLAPAAAREALRRAARDPAGSRAARQAHADELCRWVRLAWPASGAATSPAMGEVAAGIVGLLAERLRREPSAAGSFAGLDLDLSGTVLDTDLSGAMFAGGTVSFEGCRFGPGTSFVSAEFRAGRISFQGAFFAGSRHRGNAQFAGSAFRGARVSFAGAEFHGGLSCFDDASFGAGEVDFSGMRLVDSLLSFVRADFAGARVSFSGAEFGSGSARFQDCRVRAGSLEFDGAVIHAPISFDRTAVDGGELSFNGSDSGSPLLSFGGVRVSAGRLAMQGLVVSDGRVCMRGLVLDGGELSLDGAVVQFGVLGMAETSFLQGSASLAITVEFDGMLELPWATYGSGSKVRRTDTSFDAAAAHDFVVKTAEYRPGVIADWGGFRP